MARFAFAAWCGFAPALRAKKCSAAIAPRPEADQERKFLLVGSIEPLIYFFARESTTQNHTPIGPVKRQMINEEIHSGFDAP